MEMLVKIGQFCRQCDMDCELGCRRADETLDGLTTAGLAVVVILILTAFLTGCGGGGEDALDKPPPPTEEPPCKSVAPERRLAECGT